MSHARTTAEAQSPTLAPGQRVRIINKRGYPEPEGEVLIHDKEKMLVMVTAFTEEGTTTWWIPEYMVVPIDTPKYHDTASG